MKYSLRLINPEFGSSLTQLILELDFLRRKTLVGSTHPAIFFQLKTLFHMLESLGSARIEGNNTTILQYIETKIEKTNEKKSDQYREIRNVENAMEYIDRHIGETTINRLFVSELHKIIVDGLDPQLEGDSTPGVYRECPVGIKNSKHVPPTNGIMVNQHMEELFEFINRDDGPQYDLLKTAIAHHNFVWVHPFRNGNGRTVRLFTYAMLVKQGFKVDMGQRIINPTAIFCSNRDMYYDMLAKADSGSDAGILEWCQYVLSGLKVEIEKIDKLIDYSFLKSEILLPALDFSLERKFITEEESKILRIVLEKQEIQAADLKSVIKAKDASIISRHIKKLIEKEMLLPVKKGGRKYTFKFSNNYLLRGIIGALDAKDFLPDKMMG